MQWIYLADNEFSPIAAAWLYPILGYSTNDFAALAKAKENAKRVLKVLDDHFLNCTFLVGDAVTLADISLACNLSMFYKMVFDPEFRASFKNVTRWFLTCVNQPHFLTVMGVSELCEKMSVAQVVKKVEKVEKAEKPKEEKPKEAKKPKKKDDDDEEPEEDFSDKKPEGKNPLDLLPPSATFNMDAWKRCYSNNETRPVATDFFWQNFDPAGYSIYKVSYKYNSELSLIFMSSNLIGGFFNRLESARKYAFGSLVVLGEDKNSVIQGFFVFRGVGIPFEVSDCPDFESYEFEKVDHTDKASRDAFDACIAWDKTIDGKPFADGKIFK